MNETSVACEMDNKTIDEISRFIAHVITKCDNTDISLEDIKNGKVLAKSGTTTSENFSFTTAKKFDKIVLSNEV